MDYLASIGYGGGGFSYLGGASGMPRGAATDEEIEHLKGQLQKALVASEGVTDPTALTSVGALMPEELDTEIRLLTHSDTQLTLWRDLQELMIPVQNTIHAFSLATGYGTEANWTRQMENALEDQPDWARNIGFLKILRTLYKTGDIAKAVRTTANPAVKNREAAMIRLMRTFEWSMIVGDSSLMPEWVDGFQTVIRRTNSANHMLDMRGVAPTIDKFEQVTAVLRENFSTAESWRLYCTTQGRVTLDQIQRSRGSEGTIERFIPTRVGDNTYDLGSMIRQIVTGNGNLVPKANMMMANVLEAGFPPVKGDAGNPTGPVIEAATSLRAPNTPTVAVTVNAGPVTGSRWADGDKRPSNATYKYRVSACNRWGKSKATVAVVTPAVVAATGSVSITITPATAGEDADYYEIYGQFTSGDEAIYGDRKAYTVIGRKKAAAGAVTFTDLNEIYPRHTSYFILDTRTTGTEATLAIGRLLPIMNEPLAKNGPFDTAYITMTAMPLYYAPHRMIEMYNVPIGQVTMNDRAVV